VVSCISNSRERSFELFNYRWSESIDFGCEKLVKENQLSLFDYKGTGKFKAWLGKTVRNIALRYPKESKEEVVMFMTLDDNYCTVLDTLCDVRSALKDALCQKEPLELTLQAIARLPDKQRKVVYMRYIGDESITT